MSSTPEGRCIMAYLYESEIEEMAIEELQALGYTYVSGNDQMGPLSPHLKHFIKLQGHTKLPITRNFIAI